MSPSGPHRFSGPSAYDRMGGTKTFRGKILEVDLVKHTCIVQSELDSSTIWEGISWMPTTLSAEGTGSFASPEVGAVVWLMVSSVEKKPFILGAATAPRQLDEDESEDPLDYRMNRPVLNEGDHMLASSAEGFIIMRKGGLLEFGATSTAKTFYVPLTNIIHHFAENYIIDILGGGRLAFRSRREDTTRGENKSPVEFELSVKEFSQDALPIVDMRMGRIQEEDSLFIPPAGIQGETVFRFLVNNRFRIFVDKSGNFGSYTYGTSFESYEKTKTTLVNTQWLQQVRGRLQGNYGSRFLEVKGQDILRVSGNRETTIGRDIEEVILGAAKRTVKGVTETFYSTVTQTIAGEKAETISGNFKQAVGGDKVESSGENSQELVGGKVTIKVANGIDPDPLSTGYQLYVSKGAIEIIGFTGKIKLSSGGIPGAALTEITLKPSGAIKLEVGKGLVSVEENLTGVQLKTPLGEISIDAKGTVALGPEGRGGVVTTLTHPFDYITGIPILGSNSVLAGGIPSPVGTPSTFIPDNT